MLRRLREDERREDRAAPSSVSMVIRSRCRTQKIERSRSGMTSTLGLKENTASPPARGWERRHRDQHHDEQQHIDETGIGEEVEPDDTLDETDRDTRSEGDLEGDESSDQRGGECPQE